MVLVNNPKGDLTRSLEEGSRVMQSRIHTGRRDFAILLLWPDSWGCVQAKSLRSNWTISIGERAAERSRQRRLPLLAAIAT